MQRQFAVSPGQRCHHDTLSLSKLRTEISIVVGTHGGRTVLVPRRRALAGHGSAAAPLDPPILLTCLRYNTKP